MIEYKNTLCPIYECVGFIEQFINQGNAFQKMLESSNIKDKEMIKKLLDVLNSMEACFAQHFLNDSFYFTYLHENQEVSLVRALIFACSDGTQRTAEEEFIHMHEMIRNDPCIFIREIIATEKGTLIDENINEETLFKMIDECRIEDGIKWKIWQIHLRLEDLLNKIETIMDVMLPIYHQYDDLYDEFLTLYKQERDKEYPQGGMYQAAVDFLHISFSDEEVIVIPAISCLKSLTFLTKKRADGSSYLLVYWGIGTLQRLMREKELIDEESMCAALKLLSDRSKFDILRFISNKKAYGAQIANELQLSTPTISYHMQSLLNAKLVSFRKENNRLYYQLNKDYIKELLLQVNNLLTEG